MDYIKPLLHGYIQTHDKARAGKIHVLPHVAHQSNHSQPQSLQPHRIILSSFTE